MRLLGGLAARLWGLIASVLGFLVRAVGASARELDATHRRDGIGLALFTVTVVVAAVSWFGVEGSLTGAVDAVVAGAVGALVAAVVR